MMSSSFDLPGSTAVFLIRMSGSSEKANARAFPHGSAPKRSALSRLCI